MELVGKLKDKMAQAKSKDEAKEIMEKAGIKLTDDELDTVAGGMSISITPGRDKQRAIETAYGRWVADGCPDLTKSKTTRI